MAYWFFIQSLLFDAHSDTLAVPSLVADLPSRGANRPGFRLGLMSLHPFRAASAYRPAIAEVALRCIREGVWRLPRGPALEL